METVTDMKRLFRLMLYGVYCSPENQEIRSLWFDSFATFAYISSWCIRFI